VSGGGGGGGGGELSLPSAAHPPAGDGVEGGRDADRR